MSFPLKLLKGLSSDFNWCWNINFRAEYTKFIVEPVLGEAGVGGAMAVYGAFDAIVSMQLTGKIVQMK